MKTSILATCGFLALTGGASAYGLGDTAFGTATAYVVHPMTGDGLAGMPVSVLQVADPEGIPGKPMIFTTGPDGSAFITPLASGRYEAWVEHNNNRSESVFFVINEDTDFHPVVTIFFNPDLDPGN